MVRELSRFAVRFADEPSFELFEVATFRLDASGREVQDGAPTLLTYAGSEVFRTGRPGSTASSERVNLCTKSPRGSADCPSTLDDPRLWPRFADRDSGERDCAVGTVGGFD